jgi:hypothetical protein
VLAARRVLIYVWLGGAKKHFREPPHWQRQYRPSGEGVASLNGTVSLMLTT